MGIPHLVTILRPYREQIEFKSTAKDSPLQLVIDGPGLAYHGYKLALARQAQADRPLEGLPSYQEVCRLIVGLLDCLTAHNVAITAIYFDGQLPEAKQGVRTARLEHYLHELVEFQSRRPQTIGLPHRTLHNPISDRDLFVPVSIPALVNLLPAAPFIVPAVIESLLGSSYATTVHMVPGEADIYCASALKVEPGLVLTGDSDLLVYDIGKNGGVILFSDLALDGHLKAEVYRPWKIARRLQIPSIKKLAYIVSRNRGKGLSECLELARNLQNANKAYMAFASEYEIPVSTDSVLSGANLQIPIVDPRVSEYSLQDHGAGPKMYLPFLIDDPSRFSAWECGGAWRQLGYAIFGLASPQSSTMTLEFLRRGRHRIAEVPVELLTASEVQSRAARIVTGIDTWRAQLGIESTNVWRCFLLECLIEGSRDSERPIPSRADLETLITANKSVITWQHLHFGACFQAQVYSLRMVHQILRIITTRTGDAIFRGPAGEALRQLQGRLSGLPGIAALFDVDPAAPLDAHGLRILCERCGIADEAAGKKKTRTRRPDPPEPSKPSKGAEMAKNRYAVLDEPD